MYWDWPIVWPMYWPILSLSTPITLVGLTYLIIVNGSRNALIFSDLQLA